MALERIPDNLGWGGAHFQGSTVKKILQELQGLSKAVVQGAAAATNITVPGLKTTDTLFAVVRFVGARAATPDVTDVQDVTAEASIPSDGNLQLSTTDTSNDALLVLWYSKPS